LGTNQSPETPWRDWPVHKVAACGVGSAGWRGRRSPGVADRLSTGWRQTAPDKLLFSYRRGTLHRRLGSLMLRQTPHVTPAELHAALASRHPLDWGEPPAARAEISKRYGDRATTAALQRLSEVAAVEPAVTADVLRSVPLGASAHQLDNRVKSPESLARKLHTESMHRRQSLAQALGTVNDVLRYTLVVPDPQDLVAQTEAFVNALEQHGWSVVEAYHTYVDGSRYRGIHATMLTPQGPPVEIQFHSEASAEVKKATTLLYEINRDPTRSRSERENARVESTKLSDGLDIPDGLMELRQLGDQPVTCRRFGRPLISRQPSADPAVEPATADDKRHTRPPRQEGLQR
jgi:hypothetical protein